MVTPSEGPLLSKTDKWQTNHQKIDTDYGFPIDKWDSSVKILDRILSIIPIYDLNPTIDPSLAQNHLDKQYSSRVPVEAGNHKNLNDFLWNDTGSYFLKAHQDDIYVADFSDYEQYKVRRGFEKYGGKVFIKDGQIIGYEYQGQNYNPDDQWMDKIIRSTLCIKMMVEMHALRTHLCTSQRKTFEFLDKYEQDHPLADFLYLSCHGVLDVNRRIPILVGHHGLVVRLFALTRSSYKKLLKNTLDKPEFRREEIIGIEGTVWNKTINKYSQLVDNFISGITEDEAERSEFSDFFIASTAVHNQFGDAQIYSMVISEFFLPKIYKSNSGFVSTLDQNLLVTLLVSVSPRYPLIIDEDTAEIFSNPEQKEHWQKFQKAILEEYSEPNWFDPRSFEISVGF